MAKANTWQIQMAKKLALLEKRTKEIVPAVYACFTKVLHDEGYSDEQILDLFTKTQELWNESADRMEDMIEWCEKTTGITLRNGDVHESQV